MEPIIEFKFLEGDQRDPTVEFPIPERILRVLEKAEERRKVGYKIPQGGMTWSDLWELFNKGTDEDIQKCIEMYMTTEYPVPETEEDRKEQERYDEGVRVQNKPDGFGMIYVERPKKSKWHLIYFLNHACFLGKLELVKELYSKIDPDELNRQLLNVCDEDFSQHPFVESCSGGKMETIKWLMDNTTLDVNVGNGLAFYEAVYYGKLELLQLLYSTGKFDVNSSKYPTGSWIIDHEHNYPDLPSAPFRAACVNRQLETVKWLYSLNEVNIQEAICQQQIDEWLDPEGTYIDMKPMIEYLKTLPELADSPIQNVIHYYEH